MASNAYIVLRVLGNILFGLFNNNTAVYAFFGLGLIVVQVVVFDLITPFLVERLKMKELNRINI